MNFNEMSMHTAVAYLSYQDFETGTTPPLK